MVAQCKDHERRSGNALYGVVGGTQRHYVYKKHWYTVTVERTSTNMLKQGNRVTRSGAVGKPREPDRNVTADAEQ